LPAAERINEMGILDFLFGKKVEIELPDEDGKTVKRTVAKKELDKLVDKGLAVYGGAITVHVLDPNDGYYSEEWEVGEDVEPDIVAQFADQARELYVLVYYERGEANHLYTKKEIWEKQRDIFRMIADGVDQDVIDRHMNELKRKIQQK